MLWAPCFIGRIKWRRSGLLGSCNMSERDEKCIQNFATYEGRDWMRQSCKSGTDTGYWFILCWGTSLGAMVDQMLNVIGEHVEVWCVPGMDQRQNKMFHIRAFVTLIFFNSFVVSWVKRDQLDVTFFIISLFNAQYVLDVNTSSGACDLFVELFHGLYWSGSMCVGVMLWFGWGGVVSICRLRH